MNDCIYEGEVTDLLPLLTEIAPNNAFMMLECIPTRWLDEKERQNGIKIEKFDAGINFNTWAIGRIFDDEQELTWMRNDAGKFLVSYTAQKDLTFPDLRRINTENWELSETVRYSLWGTNWQPDETTKNQNTNIFLELQIPRILSYPVTCNKPDARVMLNVVIYRDHDTGHIQHYRFQKLEGNA